MAKATVTIREVKNKVTGIDLSIPSHRTIPGLLSSTVEYHVVVVTNLPVFKSAKHRETDTVQFMITKRQNDFEEFRGEIQGKFPGLSLPPLPKRDLIGDSAVQGKIMLLERFLNVIATTGKLATHHTTLQFLGVNPYKAGKFRADEPTGEKVQDENSDRYDIFENADNFNENTSPDGLFGEENIGEEEDLFGGSGSGNIKNSSQQDSLFSNDNAGIKNTDTTKLFEAQDLGGAINDEDENLFLVSGSKADKTDTALRRKLEEEDNTDLLNIEDDLDKLLSMGTKTAVEKKPRKPVIAEKPGVKAKPKNLPKPDLLPKPGGKPKVAAKPGQKPTVPSKPMSATAPKPTLIDEDEFNKKSLFSDESEVDIFGSGGAGGMVKDVSDVDLFSITTDTSAGAGGAATDDILKYIQANETRNDEDLDLFS